MMNLIKTLLLMDGAHDAAVYYEVHVSGLPAAGFATLDAPMATQSTRPLAGPDEFYLITAANAGGTSGDEPAP